MASGLPVITSRENGVSELVENEQEGFLLENPGNSQEFLECIAPLLDDNRRLAMGRAACRLARRHSFDRNVEEMVAVYEEVLEKRRAAGIWADNSFVCRRMGEEFIDDAVKSKQIAGESSMPHGKTTSLPASGVNR
jgi:hypothetical protein